MDWQNAGQNALGGGGNFNWGNFNSSLGGLLGSLFGPNPAAPYQAAGQQYQQYANQAIGAQQPFWNAGTNAIPQYQNWLNSQKDPSAYINSLMGQYQESPYAKYITDQAMKAGQNAASASGLLGSTPFEQQMAATAGGISSQDLNNWLSKVLGINTQYGAGLGNVMGLGANAANQMSNTYNKEAANMGDMAYNEQRAQNQQSGNELNDILGIGGDVLGFLGL